MNLFANCIQGQVKGHDKSLRVVQKSIAAVMGSLGKLRVDLAIVSTESKSKLEPIMT